MEEYPIPKNVLSPREMEVYNLLIRGLSYIEIARRLIVERSTILTHVLHIYGKLECNSRTELMGRRILELEDEIRNMKNAHS